MQFRTQRPRNIEEPLVKIMMDAVRQAAKEAEQKLEALTKDWAEAVDFKIEVIRRGGKIAFSVLTDSEVYNFLDKGTSPHRIPKRGTRRMSFKTSYVPKTRRNSLRSSPGGGVSTGSRIYAASVSHPGIGARNFTSQAGRGLDSRVEKEIAKHLKRVRVL